MTSEHKMLEELADKIIERMEPSIRQLLSQVVQDEVVKALRKALRESDFYKNLSDDAVEGIGKIYSTISSVKKDINVNEILGDAFKTIGTSESILDNVLRITEDATLQIMDIIEEMQRIVEEAKENASSEADPDLQELFENLNKKLLNMMTLLSFQDVAGQKIKKLIQTLKDIEEIAFELYVQTEAIKKLRDTDEEIDYEELREKIRRQVLREKERMELVDQAAIDALIESIEGS